MILNDIRDKLKEIDSNVFYGMVKQTVRDGDWDYIVFERKNLRPSANKTGYSQYYTVHLVREEYIPEGLELEVIDKMLEIPGMRLANTDGDFDYVSKPNTDNVVEMFSVDFVRALKR